MARSGMKRSPKHLKNQTVSAQCLAEWNGGAHSTSRDAILPEGQSLAAVAAISSASAAYVDWSLRVDAGVG